MYILLPSSIDIYLTGGKSHNSEIRLAKYLITYQKRGNVFVDVGAHYGYFTLLTAKLVGSAGKVYAFEASPATHAILHKNALSYQNISDFNVAASDVAGEVSFYVFPNLYAENNTLDVDLFKQEAWFKAYKPTPVKIQAVVLDNFLAQKNVVATIIKIDAEGAEFKIVSGLQHYVQDHSPVVVMEYLSEAKGNVAHQKAEQLLNNLGYTANSIDTNGNLQPIANVASYMQANTLDSDNVVFIKKSNH